MSSSIVEDHASISTASSVPSMGAGAVAATEKVFSSMFFAALVVSLALIVWGAVLIPFNAHDDNKPLTFTLALVAAVAIGLALSRRTWAFQVFRRHAWAVGVVLAVVLTMLLVVGPWRSTFTVAIYIPCLIVGTTGSLRMVALITSATFLGYIAVNVVSSVSWSTLSEAGDADGFVVNLIQIFAFGFVAYAMTSWTTGYVATVNRSLIEWNASDRESGFRTERLSVREIEIVQLLADGLSDKEMASALTVSSRTVESHVSSAMKKTGCRNRTELAVCALSEGLVPVVSVEPASD